MTDHAARFASLQKHIASLQAKFIAPHVPLAPAAVPDSYDLDVRAFCVLSHAAFEQFVEDTCVGLAQDALNAWVHNHCCSQTLLALMAFQSDRLPIDENESRPEVTFFNYIRQAGDLARVSFSNYLRTKNHGVSLKYLRFMLLSVGLDVPGEPRWLGSLNQLAAQRGDLAHKSHVKKVTSPMDAQTWVADCVEMLAKIRDDASTALVRPQFVEDPRVIII